MLRDPLIARYEPAPGRAAIRIALLLALMLVSSLALALPARADSVQIIVNPDHAGIAIDRSLLRAIFSMRLREWPGGAPIHVFVLPDDDELSGRFCRDKLGTYPYVLRTVWDRIVFTGTGLAPTVVRDEREMRQRVLSTPGAIGYIHGGQSELFSPRFQFSVAITRDPGDAPPLS